MSGKLNPRLSVRIKTVVAIAIGVFAYGAWYWVAHSTDVLAGSFR